MQIIFLEQYPPQKHAKVGDDQHDCQHNLRPEREEAVVAKIKVGGGDNAGDRQRAGDPECQLRPATAAPDIIQSADGKNNQPRREHDRKSSHVLSPELRIKTAAVAEFER